MCVQVERHNTQILVVLFLIPRSAQYMYIDIYIYIYIYALVVCTSGKTQHTRFRRFICNSTLSPIYVYRCIYGWMYVQVERHNTHDLVISFLNLHSAQYMYIYVYPDVCTSGKTQHTKSLCFIFNSTLSPIYVYTCIYTYMIWMYVQVERHNTQDFVVSFVILHSVQCMYMDVCIYV